MNDTAKAEANSVQAGLSIETRAPRCDHCRVVMRRTPYGFLCSNCSYSYDAQPDEEEAREYCEANGAVMPGSECTKLKTPSPR